MKLAKDHSIGAHAVSVPCYKCGSMLRLSDAVMDLDGPAFEAYYHATCLDVDTTDVQCPARDCRICRGIK